MKASFFEPVRYVMPQTIPPEWPLPPRFYEPDIGAQAFRSVIEWLVLVEELGFDWVSFSEHHYSARILCPSPIVMASHLAAPAAEICHEHQISPAVLPVAGPVSRYPWRHERPRLESATAGEKGSAVRIDPH